VESPCPDEDLMTTIMEQVKYDPVLVTPYEGECDDEYEYQDQRLQCELLLWYADREACHSSWHALHDAAIESFED